MFSRYSFEALDGGESSVSLKRTQEFDMPMPMDALPARCEGLAHLVAQANSDFAPRQGWTVELGILPPHHHEWSFRRIRFENLLTNVGVRHP